MELQESILLELPDAALYSLLLVCDLDQFVRLRIALGKERASMFILAEKELQKKHHLEGLPFSVLVQVMRNDNEDEAAEEVLSHGDYPEYIASILDKIEEPWDVLQYAMESGREQSALVFLRKKSSGEDIIFAMNYRCKACLEYLLQKYSFEEALMERYRDTDRFVLLRSNDLLWTLEAMNLKLSAQFFNFFLAHVDDLSPELIHELLEHMTDVEVRKARQTHRSAQETGLSQWGGAYSYEDEVTALFRARLGV